jgi:hypothetical protein
MPTNWFPFFSMLFWCLSKLFGLGLVVGGLWGVAGAFVSPMGFSFSALLFLGLMPLAAGIVLLATEAVFDLATAEMKNRQTAAK